MTNSNDSKSKSLLLMIAGAKGAVGSTVAAAVAAMQKNPDVILPNLITRNSFVYLGPPENITMAGWDTQSAKLVDCIKSHGVLTDNLLKPLQKDLEKTPILPSPPKDVDLKGQVAHLTKDIQDFKKQHSNALPVMINLLPACTRCNLDTVKHMDDLYTEAIFRIWPMYWQPFSLKFRW